MPTSALSGEVARSTRRSNPTRHPNATGSPLLALRAVAEWLGVEVVFVRRLVAERRIPFVKIGQVRPLRPRRSLGVDRRTTGAPRGTVSSPDELGANEVTFPLD